MCPALGPTSAAPRGQLHSLHRCCVISTPCFHLWDVSRSRPPHFCQGLGVQQGRCGTANLNLTTDSWQPAPEACNPDCAFTRRPNSGASVRMAASLLPCHALLGGASAVRERDAEAAAGAPSLAWGRALKQTRMLAGRAQGSNIQSHRLPRHPTLARRSISSDSAGSAAPAPPPASRPRKLSSTDGAILASYTRPSRGSGRRSGSTSSKSAAGLRSAAATVSWTRARGSATPNVASSWIPCGIGFDDESVPLLSYPCRLCNTTISAQAQKERK